MKRFELDPIFRDGGRSFNSGEVHYHWDPTPAENKLFDWLEANVGASNRDYCSLPASGNGWEIRFGYSEDTALDDYSWRYHIISYKPKGLLGHWLQIDDDAVAIEMILNGILQSCLWDDTIPHKHTETRMERSRLVNYPKWKRRT